MCKNLLVQSQSLTSLPTGHYRCPGLLLDPLHPIYNRAAVPTLALVHLTELWGFADICFLNKTFMCLEPGSVSSLCPTHSPVPGSFFPKKLSASLYLIEVMGTWWGLRREEWFSECGCFGTTYLAVLSVEDFVLCNLNLLIWAFSLTAHEPNPSATSSWHTELQHHWWQPVIWFQGYWHEATFHGDRERKVRTLCGLLGAVMHMRVDLA